MENQLIAIFKKFTEGQEVPPVLAGPRETLVWIESLVGFIPEGFDDPRLAAQTDITIYPLPEGQLQIETTRTMAARVAQTPMGAWQVFVVEGLDRATPQAGNNLLKLLEELPERTFFVATARNHLRVLPTLLSRMTRTGGSGTPPELEPDLARKVDDYLSGATLDLPAFILDKKAEIPRELAVDILSYAAARAGSFPKATIALPHIEQALRRITTSNANVRAQLDQAFLTLL